MDNKGYTLTIKYADHSHELADDLFQFFIHLKNSKKYIKALRQAKKHRQQVLPYLDNRRLINFKDLSIIMLARDYYNIVRKKPPNKLKSKTIIALLKI
jgi:hypothetical protein